MAVNVSAIISVCLYCKTNSENSTAKEFHEIFDEVGLELQLSTLVEKLFHIKVKNDGNKQLCDDCVDRLIELYDLAEHDKETVKSDELVSPRCFSATGGTTTIVSESANEPRNESLIKKCEQAEIQKCGILSEKDTKCQNFKEVSLDIEVRNQSQDDLVYDNIEDVHDLIDTNNSASSTLAHLRSSNDISENIPNKEYVFVTVSEESEDLKATSSNYARELIIVNSESECNEHIDFVEDDEDSSVEMDNINNNTSALDSILKLEITSGKDDHHLSESDNETVKNSIIIEQNDFIEEETAHEEELEDIFIVNGNSKIQDDYNQDLSTRDSFIEEADDVYYEEVFQMDEDKDCINEINSADEIEHYNSLEEKNVTGYVEIIGDDQIEFSDDAFTLEEEYLVEEITSSLEYDDVDLNEYLDKALITKFQDLSLNWETECKLCLGNYNTFKELLHHSCIAKFVEEEQFSCIIKDCEENTDNLAYLARHLILKHYDKIESLTIYGKCPDCQKTFSNIQDFNKHSCCRNIKRKIGFSNYCQYCDMDFQSLKRYVFHMQFHLTNRRPKVCLLCGGLFNNSIDFFEHTQYQHIPKTAMACTKCDRFFKEKAVFDNHMDLHDDAKYQYSCTVCPKKYTNKYGLDRHMNTYHNKKFNALKCGHCEKEFSNKTSYRNHIKCHVNDVQVESFVCLTCGIVAQNSESIKNHIESDEDSLCFSSSVEEKTIAFAYTCENCSLDFHTIEHLQKHRLSDSHSDKLFRCGICRQSFSSLRHMRNHAVNHKDCKDGQPIPIKRFFVCNIGDCKEFFSIWTSLYYHKKRPHKTAEIFVSPNSFKCQFCQQLRSSKMSLAVHVARSHNSSNIKCSHCNRGFKQQSLLQDHIDRYHTPVKCEICYKKFKHRRNLEAHNNMVHLSIKRYFCNYCEKGYFYKSERDVHENKVHPETSYKCEICKFETTYPESLKIHMDNHNKQLNFKCTICDKAFGRKQLLKCHLKRHINKKDYSCAKYLNESGCDAKFLTYNLLKTHIKKKHPNSTFNINLQRDEKLKKTISKPVFGTEKMKASNSMENRSTISTFEHLNDTDIEQTIIEFLPENDVQMDEQ